MRELIDKYGLYIILGVFVLAIAVYFMMGRKPRSPLLNAQEFYLNEATNEEVVRQDDGELPPLRGPDGQLTLVREVKISCDGGKTVKVAYLEKYSDEAMSKLSGLAPDDPQRPLILEKGLLVRLPAAGSPWVHRVAAEGRAITENLCPEGQPVQIARPK